MSSQEFASEEDRFETIQSIIAGVNATNGRQTSREIQTVLSLLNEGRGIGDSGSNSGDEGDYIGGDEGTGGDGSATDEYNQVCLI